MTSVYPISSTMLVLSSKEEKGYNNTETKPYSIAFRDLPSEDKPRERLSTLGASALSTAELLAVVLSVGTKSEDVYSMAQRMLREYGERSLATFTNPNDVVTQLNIPLGKATQIVAAIELGRRLFEPKGSAALIRTPQDVFAYVNDMKSLPKEHLRGIYINAQYRVVHDEVISIGTIDANLVHPREVFRPAISYSAAAVILVHNHPSGDPEPSAQDVAITKQLVEAGKLVGIHIVDHIIVTENGYKSVPVTY